MRCPYCLSEISDRAAFCPACGNRLSGERAVTTPASEPTSGDPTVKRKRSVPMKVLIVSAAVLIVAAAGLVGLLLWRNVQASALSDERVLELIEDDLAQEALEDTYREWGSGDPLTYVSSEVSDISPAPDGSALMIARVLSVYENDCLSTTLTWEASFSRVGDTWESQGYTLVDQHDEPAGPIPDEVLVAHVPTLMQKVDESPHVDAEGNETRLADLYVSGTQFAVVENKTGADGGTASLSIFAMDGIQTYTGTLTASFAWDDAVGDWTLMDCAVDEGAYSPSYEGLIGTWNGTLVSTEGTGSTFNCYGGKSQPVALTVKSVDDTAGTMTVDISYLLHRHGHLEESDESSVSGDAYLTANDVLVTLKTGDDILLYESDNPIGHTITLDVGENGGLRLLVETSFQGTWGDVDEYIASRTDTYELSKTS